MSSTQSYLIREVVKNDLPALLAIEQKRWAREGTAILSYQTLEEWYESNSPFFLVAEKDGVIEGFYYGMQIDFSLDDIEAFTGVGAWTQTGCHVHIHNPKGTSVYGVNVVTVAKDAGAELNKEVHRRLLMMHAKYFMGYSRLVHFDSYCRVIEGGHTGVLPYAEHDIALFYAHQTMKMIGARVWNECTKEPQIVLPVPRRPDTILKFHVTDTTLGLLRVTPNYMEDKKSRNYGAFLASEYPHTRT